MPDCVVVGGGIAGASAAYRLACRGATVTLVDRRDRGDATAAGAGIVPCSAPEARLDDNYPLGALFAGACHYYEALITQLVEDGQRDTAYKVVGGLVLDQRAGRGNLQRSIEGESYSAGARIVRGSEARKMFPPLRDGLEATYFPRYARVDGQELREALLRATQERGGSIIAGEARIIVDGKRAVAVEVEGDRIEAEAIIIAAGAWGSDRKDHLPVRPQRGQILHLILPQVDVGDWPVVMDEINDCYLVPFGPDRVVAGSTFEDHGSFDHRVTAEGQAKLLNNALRLAPGLADATVIETRVGFRPASGDGLPLLGAARDTEAIFIVNGLGRIGLTLGPFAGSLVADMALGGKPTFDLTAFDPARPLSE
jgi:D-amino-acid dehydrogenase